MNGGLCATNGLRLDLCSRARVDVALGVLLGLALAASLVAGRRLVRAPRVQDPSSSAMQVAVHAATSLLPYLRRGLSADSAPRAAPHLRTLTGASAVALADPERLLAPGPTTTTPATR
jgi:two-component system LytT family sensor kinase